MINEIKNKKPLNNEDVKIKPFLKWAGGKLRLVPTLKKKFPKGKRFIEPFVGAGAVSLNMNYPSYIINDRNSDLITVWEKLQTMGNGFVDECEKLFCIDNNKREVFDNFKKEFNETKDELRKATLFIYLNRHCFNGLCRYNGSGKYNVPFGKYDKPYFPKQEFQKCIDQIKNFKIYNKDFRKIFDMVEKDDVIYCDPPYLPISESANFDSYSAGGFSLQDQIDLAMCADRATHKGATVIISNHYNWYSKQIYTEMCKSQISTISVARTISGKINERNTVKEIIAIFNK